MISPDEYWHHNVWSIDLFQVAQIKLFVLKSKSIRSSYYDILINQYNIWEVDEIIAFIIWQ